MEKRLVGDVPEEYGKNFLKKLRKAVRKSVAAGWTRGKLQGMGEDNGKLQYASLLEHKFRLKQFRFPSAPTID